MILEFMNEGFGQVIAEKCIFFHLFWKSLISTAIGSKMTSFTNKPETSALQNPGGFAAVEVLVKESSAIGSQSSRFAGSYDEETPFQSGGTVECFSAWLEVSKPIGTSECSRGAARSARSFPTKNWKNLNSGKEYAGGHLFLSRN